MNEAAFFKKIGIEKQTFESGIRDIVHLSAGIHECFETVVTRCDAALPLLERALKLVRDQPKASRQFFGGVEISLKEASGKIRRIRAEVQKHVRRFPPKAGRTKRKHFHFREKKYHEDLAAAFVRDALKMKRKSRNIGFDGAQVLFFLGYDTLSPKTPNQSDPAIRRFWARCNRFKEFKDVPEHMTLLEKAVESMYVSGG